LTPEFAEFFFLAADLGGDGFEAGAELVELDGQSGEGERFAGVLSVFFHHGTQFRSAVEGERPTPARSATAGKVIGVLVAASSRQACSTRSVRLLVMRCRCGS
jgi:hypothetical protein